MTLGPPLWATGSWATDAWADGSWDTDAVVPGVLGDLTTLFVDYVQTLRDTGTVMDSETEIAVHLPTVRAASNQLDDANTMYCLYLS